MATNRYSQNVHFCGLYNIAAEFRVPLLLISEIVNFFWQRRVRWQNVVFEECNTISIKVARPVKLYITNNVRKTEIYSNAGRHYYSFAADTIHKILRLKNRADTSERLILYYNIVDSVTLTLRGVSRNNDSISATLTKEDRRYPLVEGRKEKLYKIY